jgi:hypothetical protein
MRTTRGPCIQLSSDDELAACPVSDGVVAAAAAAAADRRPQLVAAAGPIRLHDGAFVKCKTLYRIRHLTHLEFIFSRSVYVGNADDVATFF